MTEELSPRQCWAMFRSVPHLCRPVELADALLYAASQDWLPPTLDRTISMMAPRGRVVVMAGRQARPEFPLGPFYTKDLSLLGFAIFNASPDEQRECGTALNDLYSRSGWHPAVGITLPLSQAAAAHQLQEENTLQKKGTLSGKIVLIPGS